MSWRNRSRPGIDPARTEYVREPWGRLSYFAGAASRRSAGVGGQCGSGFAMEAGADGFEEKIKN